MILSGFKSKLLQRLTFNLLYLINPRWDTGIPAPELVRFVEQNQAGNALDLGCGTGTNLLYLARHDWSVTGIDFIPLAIRKARKKLKDYQASLHAVDVTRLPSLDLHGPFDLILDMGCFHNLLSSSRKSVIAGIKKWLKPGGIFMIYAFQKTKSDSKGLSMEELLSEFNDGFELIGIEQGRGRQSAWYYFKRI